MSESPAQEWPGIVRNFDRRPHGWRDRGAADGLVLRGLRASRLEETLMEEVRCPDCGALMALRTSKRGRSFWGCTLFPKCNGTRPERADTDHLLFDDRDGNMYDDGNPDGIDEFGPRDFGDFD